MFPEPAPKRTVRIYVPSSIQRIWLERPHHCQCCSCRPLHEDWHKRHCQSVVNNIVENHAECRRNPITDIESIQRTTATLKRSPIHSVRSIHGSPFVHCKRGICQISCRYGKPMLPDILIWIERLPPTLGAFLRCCSVCSSCSKNFLTAFSSGGSMIFWLIQLLNGPIDYIVFLDILCNLHPLRGDVDQFLHLFFVWRILLFRDAIAASCRTPREMAVGSTPSVYHQFPLDNPSTRNSLDGRVCLSDGTRHYSWSYEPSGVWH